MKEWQQIWMHSKLCIYSIEIQQGYKNLKWKVNIEDFDFCKWLCDKILLVAEIIIHVFSIYQLNIKANRTNHCEGWIVGVFLRNNCLPLS